MIFKLEEIDRGIFEALRLKLVSGGYLPDIALFQNDSAGYDAAKKLIAQNGTLIEVVGVGDISARGELHLNKIFIDRTDGRPGNIGGFATKTYLPNTLDPEKTDIYLNPTSSDNITYEITYITNLTRVDRIIYQAIRNVFKRNGYVYGIKQDGTRTAKGFEFYYRTEMDKSGNKFMEKTFMYEAVDVFIEEMEFLETVVKITEIEAGISPLPEIPENTTGLSQAENIITLDIQD